MLSPEKGYDVLDHIRFSDARYMSEIPDGAAQLVYLSPPYIGHRTTTERESERLLLDGLMKEAARVSDPQFGFVVTYNTDFKLDGGEYLRHDVVRTAGEQNGLEVYATRFHVNSFIRNKFRKNIHYIQVFIHEGSKDSARKRNKKLPLYEPDVWFFDKNQRIGDFRDGIPPESVVVLIANFTEKGELVVSQCAGTGTIVIAAHIMGRKAFGYEIEPTRADLMRIRQEKFDSFFSNNEVLKLLTDG